MFRRSGLIRFALALVITFAAFASNAQIFRAYLAPTGNDLNPCTLPAPCRLLPAALNAVADGGEVWMLEPANYNSGLVTITKSVRIRAMPGVVASLVSTGNQNAVSIAAPVAVSFRGISFGTLSNGQALYGISTAAAGVVLTVSECEFSGLVRGLEIGNPGTVATVVDSRFHNNGLGVIVFDQGSATISRSTFVGGSTAITGFSLTPGAIVVAVADSLIAASSSSAISASAPEGVVRISVAGTTIAKSGTGLRASATSAVGASATISVSGSTIVNSDAGWSISSVAGAIASITSRGNNHFNNNGASTGSLIVGNLQ